MGRKLTIGGLAQRTGVPVRTLRFYSDEGLLPVGRSASGYRMYGEEHAARVDLIRALRDAGVGLQEICSVLRSDMTLSEVLTLRLRAVETQLAGLERVAAALRLALEAGPTEENLRRITMATKASNEDRKRIVASFYDKIVEGLPCARQWLDDSVAASAPTFPATPTAEQLAAWVELEALLDEAALLACKRVNAEDIWAPGIDADKVVDAHYAAMTEARELRLSGLPPTSPEARAIIDRFVTTVTATTSRDAGVVRARMRVKFDPMGARYWELVAIMRGDSDPMRLDDWRWLGEALRHQAAEPC